MSLGWASAADLATSWQSDSSTPPAPDTAAAAPPPQHDASNLFFLQENIRSEQHCTWNALNNLLGGRIVSQEDIIAASARVLQDISLEEADVHDEDTGFYALPVLEHVLHCFGILLIQSPLGADPTLRETITAESTVGVLVNVRGAWWAAIRYIESDIWSLDSRASLRGRPITFCCQRTRKATSSDQQRSNKQCL